MGDEPWCGYCTSLSPRPPEDPACETPLCPPPPSVTKAIRLPPLSPPRPGGLLAPLLCRLSTLPTLKYPPHGDLVTIHTLLEIPTVSPSSRRDPRQPPAGSGRLGTLQSFVPEAGHSLPPSGPAHRVPAAGGSQPAPRVCLLLQTSLLSAPGKVPALSGCSWPVGLGGHGSHPVPRGRDHTHDAHRHVHAHTCTHMHTHARLGRTLGDAQGSRLSAPWEMSGEHLRTGDLAQKRGQDGPRTARGPRRADFRKGSGSDTHPNASLSANTCCLQPPPHPRPTGPDPPYRKGGRGRPWSICLPAAWTLSLGPRLVTPSCHSGLSSNSTPP